MAVDTGHGGSITFGTSAFTASVVSIGGFEVSRPSVDTSHLGTVNYRSKMPGDVADVGPFTVSILWNAESNPPYPSPVGAAETVTVIYPIGAPPKNTGGRFSGSGFVTQVGTAEMVTDEVMTGTYEITWAGMPTWAAETTV